jgi:hypothetical protein
VRNIRVKSLATRNIKGFTDATDIDVEFGDVNVVAGENGTNKTSLLSLITGLFGKGRPEMLRPGCDYGEIRATLRDMDNGEQWEFIRSFEPGRVKSVTGKSSEGGKMGAAPTFLKEIHDEVAINTAAAMTAPADEQAKMLLEMIQWDLDFAEVQKACAGVDYDLSIPLRSAQKARDLRAIDVMYKAILDLRQDINREAKIHRTHGQELAASSSEGDEPVDWGVEARRIDQGLATLHREDAEALKAITIHATEQRAALEARHKTVYTNLERELQEKITTLRAEYSKREEAAARDHAQQKEEVSRWEFDQAAGIETRSRPMREELLQAQALARKGISEQGAKETNRLNAAKAMAMAETLERRSKTMTTALDGLKQLRVRLLEKVPIPGLTFVNGIPYLNEIPLSECNTQVRAEFWLQVGALRARDLGVVCYDGAEVFDNKHFAKVIDRALSTGLQWFFGRVDNGPFRIEVHNSVEAAVSQ